MKLIFIIMLFWTFPIFGKSVFLKVCNHHINKLDESTPSLQIKWLKHFFKSDDCYSIFDKIKSSKSISDFIPTIVYVSSQSRLKPFKPLGVSEPLKLENELDRQWQIQSGDFSSLELFKEFKNLEHFTYENWVSEYRNICQIIGHVPSLKTITLTNWNLNNEDVGCIKKANLKVHILGPFIPDEKSDRIKINIFGISNFLGNIEDLILYERLEYLSLEDYRGKSNLRFLSRLRNLSHLNLNINEVENFEEISEINSLLYLSLSCQEIGRTNIQSCKDKKIKDISFISNLNWLKGLDLSLNDIQEINPILNLKNLEYLNLKFNRINNISSLMALKKLKFLDLAGNEIRDITPLRNNLRLRYLNLAGNKISDLHPLKAHKNLAYLSAGNNPLNVRPIIRLSGLLVLNLDAHSPYKFNNEFNYPVSSILKSGSSWEERNWSEMILFDRDSNYEGIKTTTQTNGIENFNFEKLKTLQVLSLGNNKLDVNPDLTKNTSLKFVDLSGNAFKTKIITSKLPPNVTYVNLRNSYNGPLGDFKKLKSLRMIDLGQNQVSIEMKSLPESLEFLKLDECLIKTLPDISNLSNLTHLELQRNDLSNLLNLNLNKLRYLNLSHNNLTKVPDLSNAPWISSVVLDHNKIGNIENITTIKGPGPFVSLEFNSTKDLPIFGEVKNETYTVKLRGNPIICSNNSMNNSVKSICQQN